PFVRGLMLEKCPMLWFGHFELGIFRHESLHSVPLVHCSLLSFECPSAANPTAFESLDFLFSLNVGRGWIMNCRGSLTTKDSLAANLLDLVRQLKDLVDLRGQSTSEILGKSASQVLE